MCTRTGCIWADDGSYSFHGGIGSEVEHPLLEEPQIYLTNLTENNCSA